MIPHETGERPRACFGLAAYRKRNWIDRVLNRLKQQLGIATLCQRQAVQYNPLLTVACILMGLPICTHALVLDSRLCLVKDAIVLPSFGRCGLRLSR